MNHSGILNVPGDRKISQSSYKGKSDRIQMSSTFPIIHAVWSVPLAESMCEFVYLIVTKYLHTLLP